MWEACQSRAPDADREAVAMVTAAPGIWGLYPRWPVGEKTMVNNVRADRKVNIRQESHK